MNKDNTQTNIKPLPRYTNLSTIKDNIKNVRNIYLITKDKEFFLFIDVKEEEKKQVYDMISLGYEVNKILINEQ